MNEAYAELFGGQTRRGAMVRFGADIPGVLVAIEAIAPAAGMKLARLEGSTTGIVWINVTTNPTAEWVARQITEAFPWDEAPRYGTRDRDQICGPAVTRRLRAMGIREKPIMPASPWQNGFAERLIGSIRRECLDHLVVFGEEHLRRILKS
jgi:hypothetical protein